MNKRQLYTIKIALEELELANEQLISMIDLMNLTESERNRIIDAVSLTEEKLKEVRMSNISELEEHVNFEQISSL